MAYGTQLSLDETREKIQTAEGRDDQLMLKKALLAVIEKRSEAYKGDNTFISRDEYNKVVPRTNWCGLAYQIDRGNVKIIVQESNSNLKNYEGHAERLALGNLMIKLFDGDNSSNVSGEIPNTNKKIDRGRSLLIEKMNNRTFNLILFKERSPCNYGDEMGCEPYLRILGILDSNVYFAVNMETGRIPEGKKLQK